MLFCSYAVLLSGRFCPSSGFRFISKIYLTCINSNHNFVIVNVRSNRKGLLSSNK